MIRAAVLALALAGCYQEIGDCGSPGVVCSGGSAGDLCAPTAGLGMVCVPQPTTPTVLSAPINTDALDTCTTLVSLAGQTPLCVIAGTDITVGYGADVLVTGSRALVLFASHDITIAGALDASSYPARPPGAGASLVCDDQLDGANDVGAGAGGGAGGSLGGRGGDGGSGGGEPGGRGLQTPANIFSAGRSGGFGGDASIAIGGGDCGLGGGALYLFATDRTTVSGQVLAFGGGGGGALYVLAGGGGGGSGGMIWIDGTLVLAASAVLAATGGGGGGGADGVSIGTDGQTGNPAAPATPAAGAPSSTPGGEGGTGPIPAIAGAAGASSGGGGGGGSQGVIKVPPGTLQNGQIYPPAT